MYLRQFGYYDFAYFCVVLRGYALRCVSTTNTFHKIIPCVTSVDKAKIKNDKELFKKLIDEIWEFRILFNKKQIRFFAFWDKTEKEETLVVATHGIIKKTVKTPEKEIEKAENIRKIYFEQKN